MSAPFLARSMGGRLVVARDRYLFPHMTQICAISFDRPPKVSPACKDGASPTLLGVPDPDRASQVHEVEVFGPVATLIP